MANLNDQQLRLDEEKETPEVKHDRSKASFFIRTAVIVFILTAFAIGYYFFQKDSSEPVRKERVYSNSDGSVPQVEEYIRKNILHDPASFTPVHWTELRKSGELAGMTTYRVGVIYKAKNDKNEIVMDSKLFELDESGNVMIVLDVGPMNPR